MQIIWGVCVTGQIYGILFVVYFSIFSIFQVLPGSFPSSNDVKQINLFHYLMFQCFSGGKVFVCNVK